MLPMLQADERSQSKVETLSKKLAEMLPQPLLYDHENDIKGDGRPRIGAIRSALDKYSVDFKEYTKIVGECSVDWANRLLAANKNTNML